MLLTKKGVQEMREQFLDAIESLQPLVRALEQRGLDWEEVVSFFVDVAGSEVSVRVVKLKERLEETAEHVGITLKKFHRFAERRANRLRETRPLALSPLEAEEDVKALAYLIDRRKN